MFTFMFAFTPLFPRYASGMMRARTALASVLTMAAAVALAAAGESLALAQTPAAGGSSAPATDKPWAPPAPPREFRGVWVATVANIDWPSKKGLTVEQLRSEMNRILDATRAAGFNAVIFQARPSCDAMYQSRLEPWSEFLSGTQGQGVAGAPPGYDPLAEWIAGAHARGMQLHAWINPYRARHIRATSPDAPNHVSKVNPSWVRAYEGYLWLDPGVPAARDHSLAVAMDIVQRYDVDGIHIDDYFYPYPKAGVPFPDSESYAASKSNLSLEAWRRANIDSFVSQLYLRVKAAKPHVLVGISPFGIWRPGFPPQVRGMDAFSALHADSRRWLREGTLDYIAPQLYWKVDAPQQPYARLLDWWIDQNDQRRHVWPGLNASRVLAAGAGTDAKARDSWEPAEILSQIELTRKSLGATGVIAFSAVAVVENRRGLGDALKGSAFAEPALVPMSPWLATPMPPMTPPNAAAKRAQVFPAPANVKMTAEQSGGGVVVTVSAERAKEDSVPTNEEAKNADGGGVGGGGRWLVVMGKFGERWRVIGSTRAGGGSGVGGVVVKASVAEKPSAVAAAWMDRVGRIGEWAKE
jgi:uncharacterized lipoprotein YddW (UPF0748 family)